LLLAIGFLLLLASDYWLLASGNWRLAIGNWLLVSGYWMLAIFGYCHWLLLLTKGHWLLASALQRQFRLYIPFLGNICFKFSAFCLCSVVTF
jgi:hypothetical protein